MQWHATAPKVGESLSRMDASICCTSVTFDTCAVRRLRRIVS
jgi:hypothetical protein